MTAIGYCTAEKQEDPPDTRPRTVADLIKVLQSLPSEALVQTEGRDCVGPWSGAVTLYEGRATIGRDDRRNFDPPLVPRRGPLADDEAERIRGVLSADRDLSYKQAVKYAVSP